MQGTGRRWDRRAGDWSPSSSTPDGSRGARASRTDSKPALLGIGVLAVIGIGGAVILRRRSTRAAGGA
ncbi:hypothetical protein GS530_00975 [Rhodococcus hoagii]|nr:hypothetical protein [Prescottella equi]